MGKTKAKKLKPNVLITGIPRSGTTLLAALLDGLPDAFCLNEPPSHYLAAGTAIDAGYFARWTHFDLLETRRRLLAGEAVDDRRTEDGAAPTNYFKSGAGGRTRARKAIPVRAVRRKGLSRNFLLGVKHNEPFTAVLSQLLDRPDLSVVAVVRHPVYTLLSWRSVPIPLSEGRLSPGYRLWPEALAVPPSSRSVLETQARIYGLYVNRYLELRRRLTVVRYEELVEDPAAIAAVFGRDYVRGPEIRDRNRPAAYAGGADRGQARVVEEIRQAITKYCPQAGQLYPGWEKL